MNALRTKARPATAGMTLVEMLVATSVGTLVIAGSLTLFILFLRSYNTSTLMRNTASRGSFALERMVIGVGTNAGLREAAAATVIYSTPASGWKLAYNTNLFFQYVSSTQRITNDTGKLVCANVVTSSVSFYTRNASTNLVVTNACRISLTVAENAGGDTWTNTMITQVQFRN